MLIDVKLADFKRWRIGERPWIAADVKSHPSAKSAPGWGTLDSVCSSDFSSGLVSNVIESSPRSFIPGRNEIE
jgi:hypothetical protein